MPNSYVEYTGNGVTATYSVPFPYLDQDHVEVYLDEVSTSAFTWASASSITFDAAPSNGAAILIKRNTPYTELVNFTTRTRLRSSSLNTFQKQLRYLVEETVEWHDAIAELHEGAEDAMEAAEAAQAAAEAAQAAAETAEANAETAETNAEAAETNAETAQAAAASSASSASTSATNAATSATNAATSATAAAASATAAAASATAAATAETNAETAEANAETAEANAEAAQAAAEAAQAAAEAAAAQAELAIGIPQGGTDGQVLVKQSGTDYDVDWETVAGTGDVVGPASSTANRLAAFDGTTGKLLKDSGKVASDFADATHSHAISDVTDLQSSLDAKLDDSQKGAASGLAELDGDGFVPLSQIPATVMSNSFAVADEAAMLALSANVGDVAIRADENKTYILNQLPADDVDNWLWLKTPTDAVLSVAGKTGAVTLAPADIDFSETDKLLGRSTSGAGDGEEIPCTAAGRALLDDADAGAQRTTLSAAARTQTDFLSVLIAAPEDKTYRLATKLPYGITITEVTSDCASGTCTATVKIDGVALGGTANSVSTTEESQSHASSNVAAAGTDLDLTVSSNSSCEDLSLMIKFTRTLD
jgi:chemotaxis protein histidine kinase CheA